MPTSPPADLAKQMHPLKASSVRRSSINLGQFAVNAAKTVLAHIFDGPAVIREIWYAGDVVPADADGTLLIHAEVFDVSENAVDAIATGFDTEAQLLVAKKGIKAVLDAETVENERTVDAGDVLQFRLVNNSAAVEANPNIVATVLWQPLRIVE